MFRSTFQQPKLLSGQRPLVPQLAQLGRDVEQGVQCSSFFWPYSIPR